MPDKVYQIYTKFGEEMRNILLRMAIDSISDTATGFSSYDFFTMRTSISRKMYEDLDARLINDVHCKVVFFQLFSIDLPNDYEDAIQMTEVTKQSILRAEAERNKNKIEQTTKVEQSRIGKDITVN